MYEFEPYKVWPRVQTDSLIFRMCKRSSTLPNTTHTIYLRSTSRKATLLELLEQYKRFDPDHPLIDKDIKFKINPIQNSNLKLVSKHSSFSFVLPAASCLDELNDITADYPRLCDGENSRCVLADEVTPLNWNRGPNTNPVYSLVVRTKWARDTFGEIACERYLKPCFYWNGKTIASSTGGGKEGEFWRERDPLRLGKKEMSAAEAYWPYCNLDLSDPTTSFYSLIMVNKDDAVQLEKEMEELGDKSPMVALYNYLREARDALQGDKLGKNIAHCQYNRCGTEVPVKIIHPINCGYYTKSQPRQRFFVDSTRCAVTNQCIYFTIKPAYPCQNADYYCGLLNSVLLQFFAKVNCCYDQQGRMRFFGRLMANIPFAPPPSDTFMEQVAAFAQGLTEARTWIYSFVRYTPGGHRLMERVRSCEWHLQPSELDILHQFAPPSDWTLQPDTSLSKPTCPPHLNWIKDMVTNKPLSNTETIEHVFITLLKIASLFQYAVDQMVYSVYKIPERLQLEVEEDLNLSGFRKEWDGYTDLNYSDEPTWFHKIMQLAQSFTTEKNLNIALSSPSPLLSITEPRKTTAHPPPTHTHRIVPPLAKSIDALKKVNTPSIQNLIHSPPTKSIPRMPFSIQQAISMIHYDDDDDDV